MDVDRIKQNIKDRHTQENKIEEKPTTKEPSKPKNKPMFEYDELKMYFGEPYQVTDSIVITQPTIGEILEFGDSKFYSIVSMLCANTTSFRLQLWDMGIDWNEISDFELFCNLIKGFKPEDTSLLFGDLNLSLFELFYDKEIEGNVLIYIPRDENGDVLQDFDFEHAPRIDEIVYMRIVDYLRHMFDIYPKVEFAKNKATKNAIIDEERMNLQFAQKKSKESLSSKSPLLPLISSMVNHPGFKYKKNELKEVGIVEFMDSVKRLQTYENTVALLRGMYSGMIDASKINKEEFNWTRPLYD